MKKEHKYFGAILSIFLFSILTLTALLRKYLALTLPHFIKTCQQIASTFLSSGVHFVGLTLIALALLVSITFCLKTVFSLMKTQRRVKELLNFKSSTVPQKLQIVLDEVKFQPSRVLVIEKGSNYAFTYGFRQQKIVLSKRLINKLTPKQLQAVVLHEMYHLKNKHPLLLIISEIISSTLFFLPLIKELNNKMRVILERQADQFVVSFQGSKKYLTTALLRVPNSRTNFYPEFTQRRNHKISILSVISSTFVIFATMFLFLFPSQIHSSQPTTQPERSNCGQAQCEVHCLTNNINQPQTMSSNFQLNSSKLSY